MATSIDTTDSDPPGATRPHRDRGPAGSRRRRRRADPRQATRPRLDPPLLGNRRHHRGRRAGVGVVGAGGHARRAGHAAVHVHDRGDVRGQRHLPPGDVGVADQAQVDEAPGPLDDLRVHRGQLHAVRPAGAAVGAGHGAVLDRLGGRGRGRAAEDVLAVGAPRGSACRCTCCSAGSPRSSSCRSCTARAWRRWCCSSSAARCTASAACSTGSSGPTRGRRRSATTSSSTPARRWRRSVTTSRCGSPSSTSA